MRSNLALRALAALSALALTLAAAQGAEPPPAETAPAKRAGRDYSPYPPPGSGYVTDLTGTLTREQEERIERWLWQTESRSGVEIAVVIVGSIQDYPGTPQMGIEAFARGLFDAYGIGNLPKNDGVLMMVALRDRKARIELGAGYGRARDDDAARIMDEAIVPRFREGDYAGGVREGVEEIIGEFARLRVGWRWLWQIGGLIAGIGVLALVAFSLFASGKRGWGWVCVGLIFVLVLALIRVIATVAKHMPEGDSSGWDSGGFGGGFGGGSSGGGGATGSW